jgi:ribosomal protein S18 acetylase RimI-like enzyme
MLIATEDLTHTTAAEVEAVVRDYFARTVASEDTPPLDFNWDSFLALQENDNILLVTARPPVPTPAPNADNRPMAGFALYVVCRHPHHDMLVAACDMIGVSPDYRGRGVASKLIRHAESTLAAAGISQIAHNHRHATYENTQPIFPKLGFRHAETVYVKDI